RRSACFGRGLATTTERDGEHDDVGPHESPQHRVKLRRRTHARQSDDARKWPSESLYSFVTSCWICSTSPTSKPSSLRMLIHEKCPPSTKGSNRFFIASTSWSSASRTWVLITTNSAFACSSAKSVMPSSSASFAVAAKSSFKREICPA